MGVRGSCLQKKWNKNKGNRFGPVGFGPSTCEHRDLIWFKHKIKSHAMRFLHHDHRIIDLLSTLIPQVATHSGSKTKNGHTSSGVGVEAGC